MMRFQFATAAFAAVAVFSAPAAAAIPLVSTPVTLAYTDIGSSFGFNFNGYINETLQPGLSATAVFRLDSVSGDKKTWNFVIDELKNTSSSPVTASRLSMFAFIVDKTVTDASGTGTFSQTDINASIPQFGGSTLFSACYKAGGGENCSSGGGGGILKGQTYMGGTFALEFANAVQSLKLDNFVVRYQSIAAPGVNDGSGVGTVAPIPEPGTWAMMIAGFGLAGAAMRRRRALATA